jgi:alpha-L-fucosidase 2
LSFTSIGIWNSDFDPMWGSKYTININLEMNYWPSLVTNLQDLNSPLYDLIDQMRINGTEVARTMYNCSGAVAHHNTDLWADCAPQDNYFSSTYYSGGLAWLSTHLMQDYLYTGNSSFLAAHYDVLRDVMLFYLDFMTEGPHGWKVTNPSISPENVYYLPNTTIQEAITMGPTIDISLIWELIGYTLEAMEVLGTDDASFKQQLLTLRGQLPPIQISYFGGVQEWIYDYKEQDPGHRHFSPLFGLYPGSQITSANATSFDAAKTTLTRRLSHGGGDTGWSRAWAISLAARSFLNDEVHHSLVHLLTKLTYSTSLLDTGPPAPFQIDGNFGGPAGVAEALIQSHELVSPHKATTASKGSQLNPAYWGYGTGSKTTLLRLLPALPSQWAENGGGSVTGLRSRGGFEVDVSWDEKGALTGANITSLLGQSVWVTVGSVSIGDEAAKTNVTGSSIKIDGADSGRFVLLESEKGRSYSVSLA